MFGVAATGGGIERRASRRLSTWTRDYLREVALADLGCAVVGVFMAAQIRFGSNVTPIYLALSLALPVLRVAALWLVGAYDVRFIGTGSGEYRKVGFRLIIKELFDRCAAAAALILLAPLMAVPAILTWFHDRGPALFTQVRIDKDGHAFRIYKFRTMVADAEQRRKDYLHAAALTGSAAVMLRRQTEWQAQMERKEW